MMNMARKQRCNATHMDDAGYKHSCKLLTGHPGDHECSKSVHSWADYKRPMNPKPLDAGLAERLWKAWAKGFMSHNPTVPLICTSWQMQSAIKSVAAAVRKIVKEAKEGK